MSQKHLHHSKISPAGEKMGSERMAQHVGVHWTSGT